MKQKEIKNLVNQGVAIDLTNASYKDLENMEYLQTIELSFGTYGMNGGLFKGSKSGKLYAITARNSNLFMIA